MEKLYDRCLRCGRKLKNEEARKIGYGKVCLEKTKYNESKTIDFLHEFMTNIHVTITAHKR